MPVERLSPRIGPRPSSLSHTVAEPSGATTTGAGCPASASRTVVWSTIATASDELLDAGTASMARSMRSSTAAGPVASTAAMRSSARSWPTAAAASSPLPTMSPMASTTLPSDVGNTSNQSPPTSMPLAAGW